ncbi:hypothetical protein SAY87_022965 [Trapa incisa]|uniref:Uncharacterized protein n=1 Tax=Trapa incisa TaxID=236973 RepID=A0AAN7K4Z0_9MYRT|nr:hypothetical protein SAY87_022965 [Trapa incisa]
MADLSNYSSHNKRSRISKGNSYVAVTGFFFISLFLFNGRTLEPSPSIYRYLLLSAGGGLHARLPDVKSDRTNPPPADLSSTESFDSGTDTLTEDDRSSASDRGSDSTSPSPGLPNYPAIHLEVVDGEKLFQKMCPA